MLYRMKNPAAYFRSTTNDGYKTKVHITYWEDPNNIGDDVVMLTTLFFAPKEEEELNNFKKIKTFSKYSLFYKQDSVRLNTIHHLFLYLNNLKITK